MYFCLLKPTKICITFPQCKILDTCDVLVNVIFIISIHKSQYILTYTDCFHLNSLIIQLREFLIISMEKAKLFNVLNYLK
jgi:hypothetical protein